MPPGKKKRDPDAWTAVQIELDPEDHVMINGGFQAISAGLENIATALLAVAAAMPKPPRKANRISAIVSDIGRTEP